MKKQKYHYQALFLALALISMSAYMIGGSPSYKLRAQAGGTVNIDQAWLNNPNNGEGPQGPWYLDESNTTYVLQTDVVADGIAFGVIAGDVTLKLNGFEILYNNDEPRTLANHSFEEGSAGLASGWDFSNAPNVERYNGDFFRSEKIEGDYALKFTYPLQGGEEYVESEGTITLEPDTRYAATGFFKKGTRGDYGQGYVQLVQGDTVVYESNWSSDNNRGMQLVEDCEGCGGRDYGFVTGGTTETYKVRVGVRGGTEPGIEFFADKIRVSRIQQPGIILGPQSWSEAHQGIKRFARGDDFTLVGEGGKLTQGQDSGHSSHGVNYVRGIRAEVDGVRITVHGYETSATRLSADSIIHDNFIESFVRYNGHRDSQYGPVISGGGSIYNNTVLGGMQMGIKGSGGSEIYNNVVRTNSFYTNGFAIANGHHIYDNVINNTGYRSDNVEFSGRGIAPGGGGTIEDPVLVYNNTVTVQELARNQEYGGSVIGGAYGMQLELTSYIYVYDNDVTVISNGTEAHAFRRGGSGGGGTGIRVYDNTFRAISDGEINSWAYCYKLSDNLYAADISFQRNRCVTNDAYMHLTKNAFVVMEDEIIELDEPVRVWPWGDVGYPWSGGWSTVQGVPYADIAMLNPTGDYDFLDRYFAIDRYFPGGRGKKETRGNHNLRWTTTFQVLNEGTPVDNATVIVTDKNSNQAFSGLTDSDGYVDTNLMEYQWTDGDQRSDFSPYTVTAVQGELSAEVIFTADRKQTIALNLDTGGGEVQNSAPNVNAGSDQSADLVGGSVTVNLNATVTDDNLPNPPALVTTTWSKIVGPADVSFADASEVDTTVTFTVAGTYVLQLDADDSELTAFDTVEIIISEAGGDNTAPSVNAGPDGEAIVDVDYQLDGTVTDDGLPDPPAQVTTAWSKISGPGDATFGNVNVVDTTVNFDTTGDYVLQLEASDSELITTDTVAIFAGLGSSDNAPPTVNAGSDTSGEVNSSITLKGSVTDDGLPDPPALTTVTWSKVSGPGEVIFADPNSAETTATFSVAGEYVVQLLATDSELTSIDTATVTITDGGGGGGGGGYNQPPTAYAGPDQTVFLIQGVATAILTGTASDDGLPNPPGELTYAWKQVNGPAEMTFDDPDKISTSTTFTVEGDYIIRFGVNDGEFLTNDHMRVKVRTGEDPGNQPPMVEAGPDKTVAVGGTVSINATVTDDGLPSNSLTYRWRATGPGKYWFDPEFDEDTTFNIPAGYGVPGTYIGILTVSDGELAASDTLTIEVTEEEGRGGDGGHEGGKDGGADGGGNFKHSSSSSSSDSHAPSNPGGSFFGKLGDTLKTFFEFFGGGNK